MLITLDIKNENKRETFLNFLATLDYIEIKSEENSSLKKHSDKKNKFDGFAGLWENKDVNIKNIREKAWK
jgi:hypothetical protein